MKISWISAVVAAWLLAFAGAAFCQDYQGQAENSAWPGLRYNPGRGLTLGESGVTLAGYWNFNYRDLRNRRRTVTLDDLSFFGTYNPSPRWQAFTEVELEDAVNIDEEGDLFSGTAVIDLERLFVEYRHSDALALRVGKFLTPFGIWNPIHAAPLVWTVSRPATTEDFFDPATTGAMVSGATVGNSVDIGYAAWAQVTDQLVERDSPRQRRRGVGSRVELQPNLPLTAALSSEFMDNENGRGWEYLLGGDLRYDGRRFEVWSEAVSDTPLEGGETEWGIYAQVAVRLVGDLFAVARFEHVALDRSANAPLVGLNYRPYPFLVFKAEYVFADRPVEDVRRGLALSLAGLF